MDQELKPDYDNILVQKTKKTDNVIDLKNRTILLLGDIQDETISEIRPALNQWRREEEQDLAEWKSNDLKLISMFTSDTEADTLIIPGTSQGQDFDVEVSVEDAIKFLLSVQRRDVKPITIEIHNSGGDAESSLVLYKTLKFSKIPVITKIIGRACSAAGILFLAGHQRLITDESVFHAHSCCQFIQQGFFKAQDHQTESEYMTKLNNSLLNLLEKNSNRSRADWEDLIIKQQKNLFYQGQEILDLGLATEMVEEI